MTRFVINYTMDEISSQPLLKYQACVSAAFQMFGDIGFRARSNLCASNYERILYEEFRHVRGSVVDLDSCLL